MRIIQEEPEKEMLCPTCGCKFAYLQKDIKYVGTLVKFEVVYCPNCDERISVIGKYAMDEMGGIAKQSKYRK